MTVPLVTTAALIREPAASSQIVDLSPPSPRWPCKHIATFGAMVAKEHKQ